jgi:ribosomal RNA-processing protein 17
MREQRREEIEEQIEAVNREWKKYNQIESDGDGEEGSESGEDVAWEGFEEEAPPPISKVDEYIDEDKYATVTVESVDITRDGFKTGTSEDEDARRSSGDEGEQVKGKTDGPPTVKKKWTKEYPRSNKSKKKKKTFRYESKEERKANRMKERTKNRAQAQARRAKAKTKD